MLTLICSLLVAGLVWTLTHQTISTSASIVLAVVVLVICHVIARVVIQLYTKKIQANLQKLMLELQQNLMKMQNRFMAQPPRDMQQAKQMQARLEHAQIAGLDELIAALDQFKPLYLWSFLMKRQVNTMRMSFLYQQKKFEEVDALLPKCILVDPQSICFKLARMYANNSEQKAFEKFFKSKTRLMRANESNVLFFATYAWIMFQRKRYEDAISALNLGKTKTYNNAVLEKNREALVNKKEKLFSNAELGDMWYSLYLEEPKMRQVRQQQPRFRG